jgi:hypothetical protein
MLNPRWLQKYKINAPTLDTFSDPFPSGSMTGLYVVCSNINLQNTELSQVEWLKELGFDHAFNYKKVTVRKVMIQVFLM